MVNTKMMVVNEESHATLISHKIIPREPLGDVLARILKDWNELKNKQQ